MVISEGTLHIGQAVVCEFLPLCLERARANAFVTVATFLEALLQGLLGCPMVR